MPTPNILVVVMDSVRAMNTSVYGYERDTTPFLRDFAADSICYTQARAPGTWSLPSHTSMFSNRHVVDHRITEDDHLKPGNTVWEWLRDTHGYATAAFTSNPYVTSERFGLDAGFDSVVGTDFTLARLPFEDAYRPDQFTPDPNRRTPAELQYVRECLRQPASLRSIANGVAHTVKNADPGVLPDDVRFGVNNEANYHVDNFLEWQSSQDGPWAAFVNLMDAHTPYLPQPRFDRWGGTAVKRIQADWPGDWHYFADEGIQWQRQALEHLYDGCIRQVDQAMRRLVDVLREDDELEDAFCVVTSDHGEGFGEQSRIRSGVHTVGHGRGLAEELLHVPLIMSAPDSAPGPSAARQERAATLTLLPEAVRALVDGEAAGALFVPDDQVVAAATYDKKVQNSDSAPAGVNVDMFRDRATAVYETVDGHVEKYVRWGPDAATIRIDDAQQLMRVSEDDTGAVDRLEFESTEGVTERRDAVIDAETEDRLKQLGYR